MADRVILEAMLVIVAALNVYGLIVTRSVLRITNETLRKIAVNRDLARRR